jgi:hypothetical protein
VRLEGEHCRGPVRGMGALRRRCDQGAVAAMNAIEIADGDDRSHQPMQACPVNL